MKLALEPQLNTGSVAPAPFCFPTWRWLTFHHSKELISSVSGPASGGSGKQEGKDDLLVSWELVNRLAPLLLDNAGGVDVASYGALACMLQINI